jgi:hypothetical protein
MLRECTYGDRGNVGEICSHTGSVDNIIESKVINERTSLQQEGEGLEDRLAEAHKNPFGKGGPYLANATSSSENN